VVGVKGMTKAHPTVEEAQTALEPGGRQL